MLTSDALPHLGAIIIISGGKYRGERATVEKYTPKKVWVLLKRGRKRVCINQASISGGAQKHQTHSPRPTPSRPKRCGGAKPPDPVTKSSPQCVSLFHTGEDMSEITALTRDFVTAVNNAADDDDSDIASYSTACSEEFRNPRNSDEDSFFLTASSQSEAIETESFATPKSKMNDQSTVTKTTGLQWGAPSATLSAGSYKGHRGSVEAKQMRAVLKTGEKTVCINKGNALLDCRRTQADGHCQNMPPETPPWSGHVKAHNVMTKSPQCVLYFPGAPKVRLSGSVENEDLIGGAAVVRGDFHTPVSGHSNNEEDDDASYSTACTQEFQSPRNSDEEDDSLFLTAHAEQDNFASPNSTSAPTNQRLTTDEPLFFDTETEDEGSCFTTSVPSSFVTARNDDHHVNSEGFGSEASHDEASFPAASEVLPPPLQVPSSRIRQAESRTATTRNRTTQVTRPSRRATTTSSSRTKTTVKRTPTSARRATTTVPVTRSASRSNQEVAQSLHPSAIFAGSKICGLRVAGVRLCLNDQDHGVAGTMAHQLFGDRLFFTDVEGSLKT